jgi:hypothetical protein
MIPKLLLELMKSLLTVYAFVVSPFEFAGRPTDFPRLSCLHCGAGTRDGLSQGMACSGVAVYPWCSPKGLSLMFACPDGLTGLKGLSLVIACPDVPPGPKGLLRELCGGAVVESLLIFTKF